MSIKHLIGALLVTLPLWLMFAATVVEHGWLVALISWGGSVLVVGAVCVGIYLLVGTKGVSTQH